MAANSLFEFSDLKLQVAQNVGAVDDITVAQCGKWINRALIRFMEVGQWSWQYTYGQTALTVASQNTVDIPNCLKVTSMYMSQPIQRKLMLIEDRQFRAMYPNDTATGTPYFYRTAGSSNTTVNTKVFGLYPIPDAIYTLKWDGIRPIVLLVNDTDDIRLLTGMPSNLVDLVIEMATAIGFKADDDVKAAQQMAECMVRLEHAWSVDESDIEDRLVMRSFEADSDVWQDPVLPPNFDY